MLRCLTVALATLAAGVPAAQLRAATTIATGALASHGSAPYAGRPERKGSRTSGVHAHHTGIDSSGPGPPGPEAWSC